MDLSKLKPAQGSTHSRKRVGRGEGSGKGGTSTRGNKGAQSRSGYSRKRGFEGGQMPLQRRVPKFGFKSLNKTVYVPVNLDLLQGLSEKAGTTDITVQTFLDHGLASKGDSVKILGRGELTSTLNVTAHAFSKSAKEAIEGKGGSTTIA